jgi:hypothetical protein
MTDNQMIISMALLEDNLVLAISDDHDRIFDQVDSFVAQSQGNDTIEHVKLSPFYANPGNYEFWDKIGQGLRNLKSLRVLNIHLNNNLEEPDWEILFCILSHIQNKIELKIIGKHIWGIGEMKAFARAIGGHPAITRFKIVVAGFSFEVGDTLCSALTTLPSLESVVLGHRRMSRVELATFLSPECMTGFLWAPSLRLVEFRFLCLTSSFCEATAMALRQGSSITSLELHQCSFPEGGSEKIARALKENATLKTFQIFPVQGFLHEAFYDAMAASLLSNSTLQELVIMHEGDRCPTSICVSSLLLALGMNKTLRKLHVSGFSCEGGSLIPALREGLGKNSTLEILELIQGGTHDETLGTEIAFHIKHIEAFHLNKTLKTFRLCAPGGGVLDRCTDDEAKHLTSVVRKNYGLESLPVLDSDDRMGDMRSILRLNGAGRGYVLDGHGSFDPKGVGVLSAVSDDLNCVFLHLLENPSLCNRSH